MEAGNPLATAGRTLPWLQDTPEVNAWGAWSVTWRDVIILDGENRRFAVFNLTENDLHVAANYDSLRAMLTSAAEAGESE